MTDSASQLDGLDSDCLEEVVGYLNFSSGASDPKFLSNINRLFRSLEDDQPREDSHRRLSQILVEKIEQLQKNSSAFAKVEQAQTVVHLLNSQLLPSYLEFHEDLLFHQSVAGLWRPFFIGRASEALVAQGGPWNESQRIVQGALAHLNDYVGYRPVATLATGALSTPYAHEFVRPIPLYIRGAGVAVGRYERLISLAIEILSNTDPDLLARAWFDLERLEEIALDPREYDFDHPVNRRPNYHFGQWDPNQISNSGYYTRMVLQQVSLDALLSRCKCEDCTQETREEYLEEAAAVLAGTILMASGTSGDGPGRHDSTVTLSTLLPHIAAYRDEFYEQLLLDTKDAHGERLRAEAERFRQPFGAARQHLNHELARRRALQMQHVHLSHLFARLGYPHAAQREAELVRVPAARMLSEIYCRLTAGHDAIDDGEVEQVVDQLNQCENLIHRAIGCGALVDPWNVVGFAGNFSLFPALENSVHDWRVDELVELIGQVLDLAARAWSESAASDNTALEQQFSTILTRLAAWWDQYATASVEGVQHLVAKEIEVSANLVSGSLNAWHKAGAAAGDIGFWRMFVDQFDSSKAFQLVIEALLDKGDTVASMALMMQWVSQKERTPLEEGDASFRRLVFTWFAVLEDQQQETGEEAWPQVKKFFAYLEANAEEYWEIPSLMLDSSLGTLFDEVIDDNEDAEYFDEEQDEQSDPLDEEEEEDEGLFQAAYEEMVYRDSSDDGREGDVADDSIDYEDAEWEAEVERLHQRLRFLTTVARLWKHTTITWGSPGVLSDDKAETFQAWLEQSSNNYQQLVELLETVHGYRLALPSGSHESLVEYDRLRTIKEGLIQKIITTCVETCDAARLLAAVQGQRAGNLADAFGETLDRSSVLLLQAVLAGDVESVRSGWPDFIRSIRPRPLLYLPHSRGGKPRQIVATRGLQQLLFDLLGWLPRLGMIRETCDLLRLAQDMERDDMQRDPPVGPGAVTEFDRLFSNGYQSIVRCIVASADKWQAESDANGPQVEHMLVDALQQLTQRQLDRWLRHSSTLRLSVVEKLSDEKKWQAFTKFIKRYGGELFDQKFMSYGNLRGILHQGVDSWLDSLLDDPEAAEEILLIEELDETCSREDATEMLGIAIEAVVENYRVYRDYNTTTTQSDHGELLYTLIDFLRLRAAYDRWAWKFRPVIWAHEILVRQQRQLAAEMWCQAFAERTSEAADAHLEQLEELATKYGMQLATISDRIGERFVRPLLIDRVKALIEPALTASEQERKEAFLALDHEIESLAIEPSGAGLDLPDWLAALEDEVTEARSRCTPQPTFDHLGGRIGQVLLSWEEVNEQLAPDGGDEQEK